MKIILVLRIFHVRFILTFAHYKVNELTCSEFLPPKITCTNSSLEISLCSVCQPRTLDGDCKVLKVRSLCYK